VTLWFLANVPFGIRKILVHHPWDPLWLRLLRSTDQNRDGFRIRTLAVRNRNTAVVVTVARIHQTDLVQFYDAWSRHSISILIQVMT